jgi:hypothetical protein
MRSAFGIASALLLLITERRDVWRYIAVLSLMVLILLEMI